VIKPGERLVGEWCMHAHGTQYDFFGIVEPFFAFDIFNPNNKRLSYFDFTSRVSNKVNSAQTLCVGEGAGVSIEHAMRNPPVPPGWWRGVNINQNAIYLECFIDEIAHELEQDPVAFRRQYLAKSPKHLAVLDAVAEKIGWGAPAPEKIYRGVAVFMAFGSYVAAAAEISVDNNKIKLHRIIAATDPGYAVNPAQIERQIAGSFVYGLSALFHGAITIKDGQVEQKNFDQYPSMHIKDMPKVETILMPSGGFWGGVGEPTICVAAPAVLNAYFAATGKRIRNVPLKDAGLDFA